MAIAINWPTKVISVPQADLTPVAGALYELDVNAFRLALKDIEDAEDGMGFPDTHRHNAQVTLSGVTYARTFEIINGYTVAFENGLYAVRCVGANHNIADVKTVNSVSLIVGNSAGLIVAGGGGGAGSTPGEIAQAVWARAIEGGYTAEQLLRAIASLGMAAAAGGGTNTIIFRDLANAKNRLKLKVKNADGDRNTPEIIDLT